ncbi:Cache 3/Cache 2 fusion domain-containing protein [Proteinivorax tanatarense]|uniref:Cache 3/Cache 2 fusion domain-containing protein n=1 Tax=Proteinivorax tanatarense TaxID=1260629 RepID=A0AAU7VKF5_9FIRM
MKNKIGLLVVYLLTILLVVGTLSYFSFQQNQAEKIEDEKEKVDFALNSVYTLIEYREKLVKKTISNKIDVAMDKLNNYGVLEVDYSEVADLNGVEAPNLKAGSVNLTGDNDFVDELSELVGGDFTVFVKEEDKFIRVSTTVLDDDGERITGTYIEDGTDIYNTVSQGESYYSRAWVANSWNITNYYPLEDKSGEVIGMIYSGLEEIDDNLKEILSDVKIGKTGYLYIMDSEKELVFSPTEKKHQIAEHAATDEIIEKANGSLEFRYQGEEKYARFKQFEPWDWHIVAVVKLSELTSTSKGLVNIIVVGGILTFIGLMVFTISRRGKNAKG